MAVTPATSHTFKLDEAQVARLRTALETRGFTFKEVPYAHFGAQKAKLTVNAYLSGKALVQGKGAAEFVEFVMEPEITGQAKLGYDEVHNPQMFEPHLGIDESGKGDFFGPLVIAGAYTDRSSAKALMELGVKDSKMISSDKIALKLAEEIRSRLGPKCYVIPIGPTTYNKMYASFKSRRQGLNHLLAWGHAEVIEQLLTAVPSCPRALSDQFANPSLIKRALKERGKGIILEQRTKAESDVAVAAASILARAGFIERLRHLGSVAGIDLPKGASAAVKAVGGEIFRKGGEKALAKVAKEHFKTFSEIVGRPHPGAGQEGD